MAYILLTLTMVSACAPGVTRPTEELAPPFDEAVLQSLLGQTDEEVRNQLGEPLDDFYGAGKSYFFYDGRVDVSGVVFPGGLPLPYSGNTYVCSMLVFDAEQRLRSYETYGAYASINGSFPKNCKAALMSSDELASLLKIHTTVLKKHANEGNPEAMFEYASRMVLSDAADRFERFMWVCRAAHQGIQKAQYELGDYYRFAYEPIAQDNVTALVWYFLSEANIEGWRSQDVPDYQFAEAKRLAAEWRLDPSECEKIGDLKKG